MDNVLETIDRSDLAFTALVRSSHDSDFVVLSDWNGADLYGVRRRGNSISRYTNIIFFSELLAQGRAHDCASDTRGCIVMSLARLSPRGVEGWI